MSWVTDVLLLFNLGEDWDGENPVEADEHGNPVKPLYQ